MPRGADANSIEAVLIEALCAFNIEARDLSSIVTETCKGSEPGTASAPSGAACNSPACRCLISSALRTASSHDRSERRGQRVCRR